MSCEIQGCGCKDSVSTPLWKVLNHCLASVACVPSDINRLEHCVRKYLLDEKLDRFQKSFSEPFNSPVFFSDPSKPLTQNVVIDLSPELKEFITSCVNSCVSSLAATRDGLAQKCDANDAEQNTTTTSSCESTPSVPLSRSASDIKYHIFDRTLPRKHNPIAACFTEYGAMLAVLNKPELFYRRVS